MVKMLMNAMQCKLWVAKFALHCPVEDKWQRVVEIEGCDKGGREGVVVSLEFTKKKMDSGGCLGVSWMEVH